METQSRVLTWTGRVITGLVGLMMIAGAVMALTKRAEVNEQLVGKLGFPEESILVVGVLEACCIVLYLIPQTAILGAVLLTGYLGGAVASHVRVHDNFAGAVIGGVLVWLGIYLRDPRVRALLPFRRSLTTSGSI